MTLHFIRPEWLFGMIPIVFFSLLLWRKHHQHSVWTQYIAPHLSGLLITQSQENKQPKWSVIICWIIAVVAMSGPAVNKQQLPVFATEQGRVILMDMSLSMYATDVSPNRLTHAKFRATDLINALKEGETGLVAYAGDAFTISPLTRDASTLLNLLPSLTPEIMPDKGSNLSAGLQLARKLLSQSGHITGDIVLMTDGISASEFDSAFDTLKNSGYRLTVLAFGSAQGAPIRLTDGQLLRDNSNEVVVAKTDYTLLKKLTDSNNGLLIPAQSDNSDITKLVDWLATDGLATETDLAGEVWQDLGPYLALLLVVPVLLSFRQALLSLLLVPAFISLSLISLSLISPPAQASVWDDLWKTADQQGQDAFQQGEFNQAAEKFKHQQWQASAQYKAGNFEQALAGFEKDSSPQGLYNQGNALMNMKDFKQAQQRYEQALALQADFPQAASNLEIAKQLQQQQEQKSDEQNQQDGDQSSDGDNSDQANNDQQNSQKGSQDNQQQSDSDDANSDDSEQSKSDQPNSDESDDNQSNADNSEQQQQENNSDQSQSSSDNQQGQSGDSAEQADKQNTGSKDGNDDNNQQNDQSEQSQSESDSTQHNDMNDNDTAEQNAAGQQTDSENEDVAKAENEASMQADTANGVEEQQTDSAAKQTTAAAQPASKTGSENDAKGASIAPSQLTNEDLPAEMQRALKTINEDPQVLIRNKMILEYQKRQQQNQQPKEREQW